MRNAWQNAYDHILDLRINEFMDKNGRHPTVQEELNLEAAITEDEIWETVEDFRDQKADDDIDFYKDQ